MAADFALGAQALAESYGTSFAAESGPEFQEDENGHFEWTREYPRNHWSSMARMGGRQVLGSVRFQGGGLVTAECKSLTMSAVLASRVRGLAQGQLHLREATWNDLSDMVGRGPADA